MRRIETIKHFPTLWGIVIAKIKTSKMKALYHSKEKFYSENGKLH